MVWGETQLVYSLNLDSASSMFDLEGADPFDWSEQKQKDLEMS